MQVEVDRCSGQLTDQLQLVDERKGRAAAAPLTSRPPLFVKLDSPPRAVCPTEAVQ